VPAARPQPPSDQAAVSTALAALLGQVGCLTLLVISVALGAGLWLDGQFGTKPILTLVLVLGSIPLTLMMMVRVLTSGMARFRTQAGSSSTSGEHEEEDGGSAS
jgi:hypothetical protein